jgi:site-specific DNA-cytosine methylase
MEAAGYAFAPVVLPAAGFGAPHGRHRIYFVAGRMDDTNVERRDRQHALLRAEEAGRDAGGIPETAWAGEPRSAYPTNGFWRNADWLLCRDGKWRPVEPGSFPLVDGVLGRVGRLRAGEERLVSPLSHDSKSRVGRIRGYGNAIVPQVAAEFVAACVDVLSLSRLDRRDRIDHGGDCEESDPNGRQNRAQRDETDEQDGCNRQRRDLGDDVQGSHFDWGHASMSAFTSAARLS